MKSSLKTKLPQFQNEAIAEALAGFFFAYFQKQQVEQTTRSIKAVADEKRVSREDSPCSRATA